MFKEKQKIPEQAPKNNEFYYETGGILIILVVLIIFSELGRVGLFLKMVLKFIFGDWYFLILFFLIHIGVKLLVQHKKVSFKSLRINGFFLTFIALLILSHQSIFNYLTLNNNAGLAGLWELYFAYTKYYDDTLIMGGGLVGALFHQIFFFLVGEIGVIILSIIILVFGIIFLTNNTIFTFFNKTNSQLKNVGSVKSKIINYFRNIEFTGIKGVKSANKKPAKIKTIRITPYHLTDMPDTINKTLQEKYKEDLENMLDNIFNALKVERSILKTEKSIAYTKLTYRIFYNLNLNSLKERIKSVLECNPLIIFDAKREELTLEFINRFKDLFTLKRLLTLAQFKEKIPFGIGLNDEVLSFSYEEEKHLYILSDPDSGYKNFLRAFFVANLIINHETPLRLVTFDLLCSMPELRNLNEEFRYYQQINAFEKELDDLNLELERRISLFKLLEAESLKAINEKIKKTNYDTKSLCRILIIITGYEKILESNQGSQIEEKLFYILSVGEKYGINSFIVQSDAVNYKSVVKNYINPKIAFKLRKLAMSVDCLDNDHALYLADCGEFFYKNEAKVIRAQAPYLAKTEYEAIIKKIRGEKS